MTPPVFCAFFHATALIFRATAQYYHATELQFRATFFAFHAIVMQLFFLLILYLYYLYIDSYIIYGM